MSVTVAVGLLSGKKAFVEAGVEEEVGLASRRAQAALGIGRGRLVDSLGYILDPCARIKDAGVQHGDWLTMHLSRVQACANNSAFCVVLGDGFVVTWGNAECGGNSSAVRHQLKNVQQIQASRSAFAEILADGSVVSWGDGTSGGASAVQHQLRNVQQIQASDSAFAAILGDGFVVTWGDAECGGDCSAAQDQLKNVQQIQASERAFAAILGAEECAADPSL